MDTTDTIIATYAIFALAVVALAWAIDGAAAASVTAAACGAASITVGWRMLP